MGNVELDSTQDNLVVETDDRLTGIKYTGEKMANEKKPHNIDVGSIDLPDKNTCPQYEALRPLSSFSNTHYYVVVQVPV